MKLAGTDLRPGIMLVVMALLAGGAWARESVDLGGTWRFQLDPEDAGETQEWFARSLPETIRLPGSLQAQGFGDDPSVDTPWIGSIKDRSWFESPDYKRFRQPGNVKIPCWLQPEKHYVGAAWYQRDIEVPASWTGQHVVLFLERCHWFTDVWINHLHVGSGESLCVPHEFVLPADLAAGKHTLTIRVDNRVRFNVGHDSHSITDHTQTNWNGIIGELTLTAKPGVWIDSVRTLPGRKPACVRVVATVRNATGKPAGMACLRVGATAVEGKEPPRTFEQERLLESDVAQFEIDCPLVPAVRPWDEFQPALYQVDLSLEASVDGKPVRDQARIVSGLRTVGSDGRHITINGRPIFLRGTLECCIFPETGYPPTDPAPWRRIMEICRDHGLNHLRFHSWCPPEAAFRVADELGFYLQAELPTWAYNMGKIPPRDDFLRRELDRVLDTYGNHPSFILMSMGNELRGDDDYLTGLVEQARRRDSRRLYACTTHHHRSASDQFRVTMRIGEKRIKIRGMRGPGTDWDFAEAIVAEEIPVIGHEIGQFCVWPDLDEIPQYTGLLKARNFELFGARLAERGMRAQARDFLTASGKLQALCYKEEIESMLRTPGFAGFQLLDLHDFPGQGTSLVGVLNAFWKEKGYISPEQYRRFCNTTVPLARLPKRIWNSGETMTARVGLAHFGPAALEQSAAEWTLTDNQGRSIGKGRLPAVDVPTGGLTSLGTIEAGLGQLRAPAQLTLTVAVPGTKAVNDWNLWVYPEQAPAAPGNEVTVVSELDPDTVTTLANGGRVVLLPPLEKINGRRESWQPIFWNTQWIRSNNRSLGLLCDAQHPALSQFPTASHSDWQWHDLVNRSVAMGLAGAPAALRPIVQVVPDWNEPRREALLLECRVGKGRLLICSIDLDTDLGRRPAARQLRSSLLDYAAGDSFMPSNDMTIEKVRSLLLSGSE